MGLRCREWCRKNAVHYACTESCVRRVQNVSKNLVTAVCAVENRLCTVKQGARSQENGSHKGANMVDGAWGLELECEK